MLSTSKQKSVVGLDVEAGSVAAAQVHADGSREVSQVAVAPLDGGLIKEGEVVDPEALSEALNSMFAEHKLSKSVRLGVANQRVAVRTLRLPLIEDPQELDTAIRFQAQEHLPMPLDQAVLDHQVVSRYSGEDGTRGMEVVAVAARRIDLTTHEGIHPRVGAADSVVEGVAEGVVPVEDGSTHVAHCARAGRGRRERTR